MSIRVLIKILGLLALICWLLAPKKKKSKTKNGGVAVILGGNKNLIRQVSMKCW